MVWKVKKKLSSIILKRGSYEKIQTKTEKKSFFISKELFKILPDEHGEMMDRDVRLVCAINGI